MSPYVVISVFSLITIYHHVVNWIEFANFAGILVVFSILAPLTYVFIAVRRKKITDIHVFLKNQRMTPFIVAIVGSIFTLICFYQYQAPTALIIMAWALIVNGTVFAILSHYWKVSMHTATFASSLTIASMLVSTNWLFLSPLILLIIWSRLARKKHTFSQLLSAAILSPLITVITILIF